MPAPPAPPTPTGPTVPAGRQTQTGVIYPYYGKSYEKKPFFNMWLGTQKDTNGLDELYISIHPTDEFKKNHGDMNPQYKNPNRVITGKCPGLKYGDADADSVQWAMRWLDKDGKELKRETNSYTLAERKKTDAAARWYEVTPGDMNSDVYSGSVIPPGARYVQVLVIYTDVFPETDARDRLCEKDEPNSRRSMGDMPLIIGAWTGYLGPDQEWTFERDPHELVTKKSTEVPTLTEKDQMTERVTTQLRNLTGFELERRSPSPGGSQADTGFDIKP